MKTALTLAALAAAAQAGMVALDVTKQAPRAAPSAEQQQRRHHWQRDGGSNIATTQLDDEGFRYYVNLDIGKPAQSVLLTLDTGSSAMWVITEQSGVCENTPYKCYTPFDMDGSDTIKRLNVSGPHDDYNLPFRVGYGDGTRTANGTYWTDTVTIAGQTIKNMIFGAANETNIPAGIMGLGFSYKGNNNRSETDPLFNHGIVDSLVDSGAINRRIFSLSLGHTDDANGTVVFGGVDSARYYDDLVSVPLVPSRGYSHAFEYAVKMQGIEIKGIDGIDSSTEALPVLLDNGAPQNQLPKDIVQPLHDKFGVVPNFTFQSGATLHALVDCAMARKYADARFGFQFTGKTIYISGADVVRDVYPAATQARYQRELGSKAKGWDGVCMFAFIATTEGDRNNLIGDPVLRHTYAVYDVDNKVVGLAQANIGSTKSALVEVGKDDKMPTKKGDPAPKSISQTGASDKDNQDSQPKGTDNGTSAGTGNGTGSGGKNDKKDAAGMLGAPLASVLLVAGGVVAMLL